MSRTEVPIHGGLAPDQLCPVDRTEHPLRLATGVDEPAIFHGQSCEDPRCEGLGAGVWGPLSALVNRWRMKVAVETLEHAGGGSLVVSGHAGEAERLAQLAPPGIALVLEPTSRSTWENVERSLPTLDYGDHIAIASDYLHARRAQHYLLTLRPDLADRVASAHRRWPVAFGWTLLVLSTRCSARFNR